MKNNKIVKKFRITWKALYINLSQHFLQCSVFLKGLRGVISGYCHVLCLSNRFEVVMEVTLPVIIALGRLPIDHGLEDTIIALIIQVEPLLQQNLNC